jgi:HAD superfamily hydrolase (TIGR01484 family)
VYRLIVSDYDGTLVTENKVLSQQFYTKLNMLANRGCIFCIASGRPYNQLKKLMFQASQNMVFISDDGAQMMYKNCVLYKKTVELDDARVICRQAINAGFTAICALREENRSVKSEQLQLPFFLNSDIFKIIIVKDGKDVEEIKRSAASMRLRVCYEDGEYLEFCHKDANKGEAVKKLMQRFSVNETQMLVLGDGENDISMLSLTKNRVFPKNAKQQVLDLGGETVDDIEKYIIEMK